MGRNTFPREWYIPKGSTKIADKASDAVAYVYSFTNAKGVNRHGAAMFYGKQAKPVWHYTFLTQAALEKEIRKGFEGRQAHERYIAGQRAERKAYVNHYKVGDILGTCWGYDQTNREYFEVVEVKGKQVVLREVAKEGFSRGWAMDTVAPMTGKFVGKPITRLAQKNGVKIDNVRWASPVDYTETAGVRVYRTGETTSYA